MRHAVIVLAAVVMPERFRLWADCRRTGQQKYSSQRWHRKNQGDQVDPHHLANSMAAADFLPRRLQENQRPNLLRETLSLQGMTAIQAYDGATGWQIQPFGGHKDPEFLGEDDLRDLLLDADFDGPLVDYKEKGNTVEFLGHDVVDGDDALRLKVTQKNGDIIYYFLDPDTFLEIRKEVQEFIRGSVRESVVEYGSYKPVAGVMYPFAISQGSKANPAAQTTTIEKIEVNVNINPSDFAVPGR